MSDDISRRTFLKSAPVLVVLAAIPQCVAVGRIPPNAETTENGTVEYTIRIADYPVLNNIGGSIKLVSQAQMKLNPDHIENRDPVLPPPRGRYPIAVTRIAAKGVGAFVAVSTYCTHGSDYQLDDYDPEKGEFVCPHKESSFRADGTHIPKPNTPKVEGNLRRFPARFDQSAGTITLTIALGN